MRKVFEGVLPPSDHEVDDDFKKALVVLDTNVLLDLYRYSRSTAEEYLASIEFVGKQLWMPYQVGLEFLRNRNNIRANAHKDHADRIKKLTDLEKSIEVEAARTHVGGDEAEQTFVRALAAYKKHLDGELRELRSWGHHYAVDETLQRLVVVYGDNVGAKPDEQWVTEHTKRGKERFSTLIPPGFKDAKTKDDGGYGDYFLWAECLEECRSRNLPLVLVTGDGKPDWIQHSSPSNSKLGPRIELLQEFHDITGQRLYIYNPLSFFDKVAALRTSEPVDVEGARNEIEQTQRRAYESLMPELSSEASERLKQFLEPRLKLKMSELLQNTRPFSSSYEVTEAASAALQDAIDKRIQGVRRQAVQDLVDDLKALNREADDDSEPPEDKP